MIDLSQTIVDRNNSDHQRILGDMQGNILHGHGRQHARHIFLQFKEGEANAISARQWIQNLSQHVTTMAAQLEERDLIKANPAAESTVFCSFMLSATGYRALGFDDASMPKEASFSNGMKNAKLSDPAVATWEDGFKERVDALVILAGNDEAGLDLKVSALADALSPFANLVHLQVAKTLKNFANQHIEHFGYVDGISQPLFFKDEIDPEEAAHGADGWKSQAKASLVLVPDPLGNPDISTGSFCVYRKLKQDVNGFRQKEQALADEINRVNQDTVIMPEQAGALIVGRFRDGTPVTNFFAPRGDANPDNSFIYLRSGDKDGIRCPFQAHIRKTNPRFDSVLGEGIGRQAPSRESELNHRIVRRGIPYGKPGEQDVGLIFICFQSNIKNQFEFMQSNWANNKDFVTPGTGIDPVIGQNSPKWKMWNQPNATSVSLDMSDVVTLKGGEYFFAPSLTFLREINDKALELAQSSSSSSSASSNTSS